MTPSAHAFTHLLLTRFNLRWGPQYSAPGEEWLAHRFELFERFCYPSVRAQSNQNFRWLVWFDTATPDAFRGRIEGYARWDNFVPLYLEIYDLEVIREQVSRMIGPAPFLITTRLDNDDALCRDFVDLVQRNFRRQECEFLNFPYGYVWHEQKIYLSKQLSNPFISLIERGDGRPRTVWYGNHRRVAQLGSLRQVRSGPAWLQVVHERNLLNEVQGIRRPITRLAGGFTIRAVTPPPEENRLSLAIDQARGYVREFKRRAAKRIRRARRSVPRA